MTQINKINQALVEQAQIIFETMVFNKISVKEVKNSYFKYPDHISACIDISCEYADKEKLCQTLLVISFPKDVYLNTANSMFMEEKSEITDENNEVGLEIVNMIAGQTKLVANEMDLFFPMASPEHFDFSKLDDIFPEDPLVISNNFESPLGSFYLNVFYL